MVLAGPILRKVTPTSVTVWLAMRVGGDVTLTVLDALNAPLASGHRHTVAVGTQLHIVCVTAVSEHRRGRPRGRRDLPLQPRIRLRRRAGHGPAHGHRHADAAGRLLLRAPSACRASACRRRRWTTCASCAARAASRMATAGIVFRSATSCSRKPRPIRSRGRTSCCSPATRSTRTMSRLRC